MERRQGPRPEVGGPATDARCRPRDCGIRRGPMDRRGQRCLCGWHGGGCRTLLSGLARVQGRQSGGHEYRHEARVLPSLRTGRCCDHGSHPSRLTGSGRHGDVPGVSVFRGHCVALDAEAQREHLGTTPGRRSTALCSSDKRGDCLPLCRCADCSPSRSSAAG